MSPNKNQQGKPATGGSIAAVALALAASAAFHATLWFVLPDSFARAAADNAPARRTLELPVAVELEDIPPELLPEEFLPPKPKFVEINPDAPNLLPPDTRNVGAATQRAAQPDPDTSARVRLPAPKVDGGDNPDSIRVQNNIPRELRPAHEQPIPGIPLGLPTSEPAREYATAPAAADAPAAAQSGTGGSPVSPPPAPPPTPGTSQNAAAATSPAAAAPAPSSTALSAAAASSVAESSNNSTVHTKSSAVRLTENSSPTAVKRPAGPNPSETPSPPPNANETPAAAASAMSTSAKSGAAAPAATGEPPVPPAAASAAASSAPAAPPPLGQVPLPPSPLPRPQAAKVGTTGDILKVKVSTCEAGTVALDARFTEYGDYTQRFLEIIQAQWWQNLDRLRLRAPESLVVVEFTLCKDGTLKDVVITHHNSTEPAAYASKDALESRSPFDPWPPKMIEDLGNEDRASIVFHYRYR